MKSLPYKIHTFLTKTAIKVKTKLSVSSKACNSLEQPRRKVSGKKDIFLSIPPSKTPKHLGSYVGSTTMFILYDCPLNPFENYFERYINERSHIYVKSLIGAKGGFYSVNMVLLHKVSGTWLLLLLMMMIALVYAYLAVPLVYEFVYSDILLENVNYPVERVRDCQSILNI